MFVAHGVNSAKRAAGLSQSLKGEVASAPLKMRKSHWSLFDKKRLNTILGPLVTEESALAAR